MTTAAPGSGHLGRTLACGIDRSGRGIAVGGLRAGVLAVLGEDGSGAMQAVRSTTADR